MACSMGRSFRSSVVMVRLVVCGSRVGWGCGLVSAWVFGSFSVF